LSSLRIETPAVFEPLLEPARYKGAHGGRGSAKSHFFAGLWLEESVSQKLDFVMLRETLKSLEFSVKKLLESKIEQYNAGDYFEVQDRRIFSKLGGVTIFEGMQNHTAESIKSLEGFDRGWFEEAQTASDTSLTMLRPTIRKPGSQLWFSWNPKSPMDPIDRLLRSGNAPESSIVIEANYKDNPFFPEVLREEMEYDRRRDIEKFNHVWLGAYQNRSETRVFKNWKIEEFDVPKDAIIRQGADWGFSIDPTVLVQCFIVGRKLYIPYEAYRIGCEISDTPTLFMSVPDSELWPIVADSARPETISHMQRNGFPKMQPAVKGAKSLEEGIEFLRTFDIIVHPRCVHTIDELGSYSYKTDPLTEEVIPILEDKNNHVIDALRYACEGARRALRAKKKAQDEGKRVSEYLPQQEGWMGA